MIPLCFNLTLNQSHQLYECVLKDNDADTMRKLCCGDLYFLLSVVCKRSDMQHEWIYARCREYELKPDEHIDLWPRFHYKSTIISFGGTIQAILNNPEETIGIFSHTRPIAKKFLYQIKNELESNSMLQDLFPDILYKNPEIESPRWSLDNGIIVKRKSNSKEGSVEAWGLIDGQPTGAHFSLRVYDDIVTRESVTTPDMIEKTNQSWALSLKLTALDKNRNSGRSRYVGTRYHLHDTYKKIIDTKIAIPRYHYPTDKGKEDINVEGNSYLMKIEDLRRDSRVDPYLYSSQMLQNPVADKSMGFKIDWLMTYNVLNINGKWNYYIVVDAASSKKVSSDYTVMMVIGLGDDNNYYIVDGVRDRMNLTERASALMMLHRKWKPKIVGYERYGKDSDIEHIKYVMEQEQYRFGIVELAGRMPKNDRIRRLIPLFESNRFWIPSRLLYQKVDGTVGDLSHDFMSEYVDFPVSKNDDILDSASRIIDEEMTAKFPMNSGSVSNTFIKIESELNYDPLSINRGHKNYAEPANNLTWKDLMKK